MTDGRRDLLAERFEANRTHLRAEVVFDFTIVRGKVVEIDLVADPEHLRVLELVVLGD